MSDKTGTHTAFERYTVNFYTSRSDDDCENSHLTFLSLHP